ncbi:MAG TPA: tetratricopeptide repeat protein [Gemmatimonadales bacterium]|nr:tetratricopeptide repeat protein [Gemmatimonadales bacterium]
MTRLVITIVLLAGVTATAVTLGAARRAPPPAPLALSETEVRNLDIEFYRARVARDPLGARDRAQLAGLYLSRARETGDNGDLVRAEETARGSLANRRSRNGKALAVLVNSLLAQHRYPEALAAARDLAELEPEARSVRALLGEIEMELGLYDSARATFGSLASWTRDLAVAPRLARWLELQGHNQEAHRLLVQTRDNARRLPGLPAEQAAWFELRVGDIALRNGRLAEAADAFRAGLAAHPEDYRLLAAEARLAAMSHDWRGAIDWGERAIARQLDPATLGLVGDAYAARGDSAKAQEYYRVLDVTMAGQTGPFHRAWSLFLLDHDRRVPDVLRKAREEISIRQDVYGWDLLAWALHKSARDAEAADAMGRALELGTRDAMLFYHAAMIEHALGHDAAARARLEQAFAVNPYWHPRQPAAARAALGAP